MKPIKLRIHYRNKGECECTIYAKGLVIVTQLDNDGLSITNGIEEIATQLSMRKIVELEGGFSLIEHYPHSGVDETFDWVFFEKGFTNPSWRPTTRAKLEAEFGIVIQ